jgi:hypothetical protein
VSEPASSDGQAMAEGAGAAAAAASGPQERPEMAVGGAFVGGLVLALILKRLAR